MLLSMEQIHDKYPQVFLMLQLHFFLNQNNKEAHIDKTIYTIQLIFFKKNFVAQIKVIFFYYVLMSTL